MDKLAGMLHISRKAGKLLLGKTAVLKQAESDRALFIITSRDAGSDLKRKLTGLNMFGIDLSSDQLGEIFGRDKLSVLAITDSGLAANVKNMLKKTRGSSKTTGGSL